jgi:phosphopentomutase
MGKVIQIILDGLGVGAMPDVKHIRKKDIGSNTLKHLLEQCPTNLPNLSKLGLGKTINQPHLLPVEDVIANNGVCYLSHYGADSYAGHNEIMGANPKKPLEMLIKDSAQKIEEKLKANGFGISYPLKNTGVLLVNKKVLVADNMENDPGQIINVTGSLDEVNFNEIVAIAKIVRQVVFTSRVIALGGTKITVVDVLNACYKDGDRYGVNTPKLDIYNDQYHVRHLGYGINPEMQIPSILMKHHYPVYLIGKMADVLDGDFDVKDPVVNTSKVFEKVLESMSHVDKGLISATVQETDLAGHEQNCHKFAEVLEISDQWIGKIVDKMNDQDLLIISADHGNDPTIGHSGHTREMTPLIVYNKTRAKNLGVRKSLSDMAATIAEYFDVPLPENGSSFLDLIYD